VDVEEGLREDEWMDIERELEREGKRMRELGKSTRNMMMNKLSILETSALYSLAVRVSSGDYEQQRHDTFVCAGNNDKNMKEEKTPRIRLRYAFARQLLLQPFSQNANNDFLNARPLPGTCLACVVTFVLVLNRRCPLLACMDASFENSPIHRQVLR
jgi:hypothetical protein